MIDWQEELAKLTTQQRELLARLINDRERQTTVNATSMSAYVVGSPNTPDGAELKAYLQQRLPEYMVPDSIRTVAAFPRLPNGKIDLNGLRREAQVETNESSLPVTGMVEPRNDVERSFADVWQEVLGLDVVSVHDNFFEVGGDSIIAIRIVSQAREAGLEIMPRDIASHPTIAQLATLVADDRSETNDQEVEVDEEDRSNDDSQPATEGEGNEVRIISIQPEGTRPPLCFVHTLGEGFAHCRALLPYLGEDQPVFGVSNMLAGYETDGDVEPYAEALLAHQPDGPYHLVGLYCGGRPAIKLACHLRSLGKEVATLAMVQSVTDFSVFRRLTMLQRVAAHLKSWASTPPHDFGRRFRQTLRRVRKPVASEHAAPEIRVMQRAFRFESLDFDGDLTLFRLREMLPFMDPHLGWGDRVRGDVIAHDLPGDWTTLFVEPAVAIIGQKMRECTDTARTKEPN